MIDFSRPQLPQNEVKSLLRNSVQISTVQPGSPAEDLGIEPGWEILRHDGKAPNLESLNRARLDGIRSMTLLDPVTGRTLMLNKGPFPLGVKIIPKINHQFVADLSKGKVSYSDLHRLWNLGNWTHFARLIPPLEQALFPSHLRLFAKFVSTESRQKHVLESNDWATQQFLALASLAGGQRDRAIALIDKSKRLRGGVHESAVPTPFLALECFVRALAAYMSGDQREAIELAEEGAYVYGAECNGLLRLYGELSGQGSLVSQSQRLGKPFPVDYTLEQVDPLRIWPAKKSTSLTNALTHTGKDQVVFVYTLDGYRTNEPFRDEMESLVALYKHAPERISVIHLVTSQTGAQTAALNWAKIEHEAKEIGLPVKVLMDPKNQVAKMLGQDVFPGLHILDYNGIVLATELCADEDGYWLALARMQ